MTSITSPAGNQPRAIYLGNTLIVRIQPDAVHPQLWRLHWPSGQVSDLTSLARALDAALVLAELNPGSDRRRLRREIESDSPSGARRRAGAGRRGS
jgi:hypothetical protein